MPSCWVPRGLEFVMRLRATIWMSPAVRPWRPTSGVEARVLVGETSATRPGEKCGFKCLGCYLSSYAECDSAYVKYEPGGHSGFTQGLKE